MSKAESRGYIGNLEPIVLLSQTLAEHDTYLRDCRCARALKVAHLERLSFGTRPEVRQPCSVDANWQLRVPYHKIRSGEVF